MRFSDLFEQVLMETNIININTPINIHFKNEQGHMVSVQFAHLLSDEIKYYVENKSMEAPVKKWVTTVYFNWVKKGCEGLNQVPRDVFPDYKKDANRVTCSLRDHLGLFDDLTWGSNDPSKTPDSNSYSDELTNPMWANFVFAQFPRWASGDVRVLQLFDYVRDEIIPLDPIVDYLNFLCAQNDPSVSRIDHFAVTQTMMMAWRWHAGMQKNKTSKIQEIEGEDYRVVMRYKDGYLMIQLLSPKSLDRETELCGHCVGKGGYDGAVVSKQVQIYSLRDNKNMPMATLDVSRGEIRQVKGHMNKSVEEKVHNHIYKFIITKGLKLTADHSKIGLERE